MWCHQGRVNGCTHQQPEHVLWNWVWPWYLFGSRLFKTLRCLHPTSQLGGRLSLHVISVTGRKEKFPDTLCLSSSFSLFPLIFRLFLKNLFFPFFGSATWHMYLKPRDQESKPHPLQWKHGVLTIGLPRKPLPSFYQQHLLLLLSRWLQVYILITPAQHAFSFS